MVYLSSDLQTKGFSLFLDREQRIEVTASTSMPIAAGESIEFFLGLKHFVTNHNRIGKIVILEEEYRVLSLDIVQEIQGEYFRRFDEIESVEIETTFDSLGFMKNLLSSMKHIPFYNVLEFIEKDHMHDIGSLKATWCTESKVVVFGGKCPHPQDAYSIWGPSGFWGEEVWPAPAVYNFFSDFFVETGSQRLSIFEQYRRHRDMRNKIRYNFTNSGFSAGGRNYNFANNIRPEVVSLLDSRWKNSSFEIDDGELRETSEHIMARFQSWYSEPVQLMEGSSTNCENLVEGLMLFKADWPTVLHHTELGKVSTYHQYTANRGVLVSLLGLTSEPSLCVEKFGTVVDNPASSGPILSENGFMVVRSDIMEDMGYSDVVSEEYQAKCDDLEFHPAEMNYAKAFYSIFFSNGKIAGRKVFDAGMGTEHRYFLPFGTFLDEQEWSIDDFCELYKPLIDQRCTDLERLVVEDSTMAKVSMYSEFNSQYTKAPFDNIEYYTALPIGIDSETTVSKRLVTVNDQGAIITEFSSEEELLPGDFTGSINKDEYVSSVEITNSLRVFISDFMQTRIKIKVKENVIATDNVKIRVSASDMTFIQKRDFNYESK